MANKKITALDAITAVTTDDLLYVIDAPGTTPVSKKITFDNLQKSISVVGGAAGLEIYFGADVNGSWRIAIEGNNLSFQRKETGVWVEKGVFEP